MEEENNNTDVFGELDWYKAKTVEEMRSDLITMAKGNYFSNEQSYVFKASGKIVIRSGEEINDQAPEGPGPEEYEQMNDEQIVQQYITRIKMYPPLVQIENKEEFAEAYLPALDNMNNVAAMFSDIADYIWSQSDGATLYSNVINDAVTKSVGYLMIDVDVNADRGMGEVVLKNPNSFDLYVDPKSRDPLYRDASFILCRKLLPKEQLQNMYPEYASKIKKANGSHSEYNYSPNTVVSADIQANDINTAYSLDGSDSPLIEYIECFEKEQRLFYNVFISITPKEEDLQKAQWYLNRLIKEVSNGSS